MTSKSSDSVGVIGCGQIAEEVHLPVIKAMGLEVAWVIDANEQRAETVARAFGTTAYSATVDLAMLPEADVVLMACPYGARGPYYDALQSAMPGAAILVEKPLALTLEEHDAITALRSASMVGAGYNRRCSSQVNLVKRLIDAMVHGSVRAIDFQYGNVGVTTGGKYVADLGLAGGGPLLETGVHGIDAINFILDVTSTEVNAVRMIIDHGFDIHTEAEYQVECGQGPIDCTLKVTYLQRTTNCVTVTFDNCQVEFSLFGSDVNLRSLQDPSASFRVNEIAPTPAGPYHSMCNLWRDFLGAVRTGQANHTSLVNSRVTTAALESIYAMGRGGSGT